jgi:hypothetical protein
MARPSTVFSWAASGGAYLAAIPTAIRNLGFVPFSTSVAEWVNQALNDVGDWIDFLAAFHPQDGEIDVGRITGNGDPGVSGRGLFITTDGTGTGILVGPPSGDPVRIQTTGVADVEVSSTNSMLFSSAVEANFGTLVGIDRTGFRADHANRRIRVDGGIGVNTANFRVPYQSSAPLSLTLPMWPGMGGWTYNYGGSNNSFGYYEENVTLSLFYVNSLNGASNVNLDLRRPLPSITGNSEASATIYRLTAVTSEWGSVQTVDPDVQIVERLRTSPYTETVLATVNRGSATWTGSVALTPQTHDYYTRMTGSIPNSGLSRTTGLGSLFVTISKTAVE